MAVDVVAERGRWRQRRSWGAPGERGQVRAIPATYRSHHGRDAPRHVADRAEIRKMSIGVIVLSLGHRRRSSRSWISSLQQVLVRWIPQIFAGH